MSRLLPFGEKRLFLLHYRKLRSYKAKTLREILCSWKHKIKWFLVDNFGKKQDNIDIKQRRRSIR